MKRAVIILVHRHKEILLLKRQLTHKNNPGQFSFPGGKVDPGETIVEAAVRELEEETGLKKLPEELTHTLTVGSSSETSGFQLDVFVLNSELLGEAIVISDEHLSFKWVNKETINALDVSPVAKRIAVKFLLNA